MLSYLTPGITIELICFFTALICLPKSTRIIWKIMPWYMLIVCATELTGLYLKMHRMGNQWAYNILLLFQISFISLFFSNLFAKYKKCRPLVLTGLAFLILMYTFELFTHGVFVYNNTTYTVSSVFFVIYSMVYYNLLLKDEAYINLKFSPEFWCVAGLLLFCFGSTMVNLFHGKLSGIVVTSKHHLPYYIFILLNWLLYGCWTYAFICKKWITTSQY